MVEAGDADAAWASEDHHYPLFCHIHTEHQIFRSFKPLPGITDHTGPQSTCVCHIIVDDDIP
jgi:hypothetical protein